MPVKTLRIDPDRFFLQLAGQRHVCFFKSATPGGWGTLLAFNPADIFSCRAGGEKSFKAFVQKNVRLGRKLIGYCSYDLGYALHCLKKRAEDDLRLPDIFFLAFDSYIRFRGTSAEVHCGNDRFLKAVDLIRKKEVPAAARARSTNFSPETTRQHYEQAYDKIRRSIFEGHIYQINLTRRFKGRTSLPPGELFLRVAGKNPVDFLAYIEGDGFEVISASPERFIKTRGRSIATFPVKGTRRRGRTAQSDERLRRELLSSKKEAAELNMITDLLRNDLGRVCEAGSVRVAGSRLLSRCPTVWHTYAEIQGRLSDGLTPVDALMSMLPAGSVTGCPKKRAMEIIDELEPKARSIYTGVIGHIDPNLDLDFSVAIRTIIKKGSRLYLQTGGGIVYDSVQKAEFDETLAKAKSFMKIL